MGFAKHQLYVDKYFENRNIYQLNWILNENELEKKEIAKYWLCRDSFKNW